MAGNIVNLAKDVATSTEVVQTISEEINGTFIIAVIILIGIIVFSIKYYLAYDKRCECKINKIIDNRLDENNNMIEEKIIKNYINPLKQEMSKTNILLAEINTSIKFMKEFVLNKNKGENL